MVYNEIRIEGSTDVVFRENVARCFEAYGWQVGGLSRERVPLDCASARVAVEAGIKLGWEHYVGLEGGVVGMDGLCRNSGALAPAPRLRFCIKNLA